MSFHLSAAPEEEDEKKVSTVTQQADADKAGTGNTKLTLVPHKAKRTNVSDRKHLSHLNYDQ